jgi:hypothetical protein
MSYIILRGCWFHVIVLNAPTEDKIDYIKDSFYEELKHIFDKIPKYHINILLWDFSAKVGREGIFKSTVGNESLHEINKLVAFSPQANYTDWVVYMKLLMILELE